MNTRELRIGNYVSVGGKIVKVNGITQHKIGYAPEAGKERYARSREVSPIDLTNDIVVSLSFNNMDFMNGLIINQRKDGIVEILVCGYHAVKITHLHVLQNYYFACTGEELTVEFSGKSESLSEK